MQSMALRLSATVIAATLAMPVHAIEGTYKIAGFNSSDKGSYKAEARIHKTGDTFSILFKSGNVAYVGTGIVINDVLSVVFQPLMPNSRPSVASYRIENDEVVSGSWTLLGGKSVGQERWTLSGA